MLRDCYEAILMRLTAGGGYGRLVEEGERTLGVAKWWDVISGDKSYCLII